ncbi:MAG: BamA/TamA family outer membrane protein, partial [Deinococcales bacterium]|nr:BamA/TamA family outer membrane protein [Chitinophagaceae bacterium]
MNKLIFYIIILCSTIVLSCSVRKKMPPNETLYNGSKVTVTKDSGFKVSIKSIRKQMEKITVPEKNKMILGWPYKVAFWYALGEPKKQTGFKHWLRTKFAEPPVFGSTVNTKLNSENMKGYLENQGYYRTKATGDTSIKGYKLTAKYKVTVAHPYAINTINWKIDSSQLLTDILNDLKNKTLLIPDERVTLDKIKTERSRVDLLLKNKGYYYFNPDYIIAYIDTSLKNYKANIYMSLKPGTPNAVKRTYIINNIVVFPNYTLLKPAPDTSLANLKMVDSIYIRDTINKFKPFVFSKSITYRPGSIYSLTEQNKTLNRFINLGAFKFVKNRFEAASISDTLQRLNSATNGLNAYYYLTPQKKKTIQAEIGTFGKSNSYVGGQLNINWLNRNVFKGAESFNVKTYVSYETASIDSLKNNNNYRIGTEISLVVPRFFVPFKVKDNNLFPPRTRFTLGYEWFRRQQLYTKNFSRIQYEVNWKSRVNVEQTIAPVSITYTNTSGFSPKYLAQVGGNEVLRLSNLPEIVSSSFYNFLTSTTYPNAANIFYFNANIEAAGNIAGAATGAKTGYSKTIAGAYFAQYVKADFDFRYTRKLLKDLYIANRVIIGIGVPYGNSKFLPFSRQFIIGGSSSLRGFSPRNIGPGTTLTSAFQQ